MITVTCPQCKRSYQLAYDPKAIIGQRVKCKGCGAQFVVEANATGEAPSMSGGKKLLLIGIPAGLILIAGVVVAILFGLKSTSRVGREGDAQWLRSLLDEKLKNGTEEEKAAAKAAKDYTQQDYDNQGTKNVVY